MNEIFPEVLPEKCQACPELSAGIEAWRSIDTLREVILAQDTEMSADDLAALPDELVRYIGDKNDQSLDPAIDADRQEALKIMQRDNGAAYVLLGDISEEIEQDIKQKAYVCQDKGPIKLRVKTEVGSTIVSLCRAEVKSAHSDHEHRTTASLIKEV